MPWGQTQVYRFGKLWLQTVRALQGMQAQPLCLFFCQHKHVPSAAGSCSFRIILFQTPAGHLLQTWGPGTSRVFS